LPVQLDEKRLLEAAYQLTPDVYYLHHVPERRNLFLSASILTLLGYSPEEVQAMGSAFLAEIVHPEDRELVLARYDMWRSVEDDGVRVVEYRMRHRDGHYRWLESRERVFDRAADGTPLTVVGIARDIHGARIADEARREVTRNLRGVRSLMRALVRESDASKLIWSTTDALVNELGFSGAWIGLSGDREVQAGSGVLSQEVSQLLPCVERSRSVAGSLRIEQEQCSCAVCPFRAKPAGSTWAARIAHGDDAHGVLVVRARDLRVLSPGGEGEFVAEFAAELGFALSRIHSERDRDRAVLALGRSALRLDQAQQVAGFGIWDTDLSTGNTTFSSRYSELFGFTEEDRPSPAEFLRRVHPLDRPDFLARLRTEGVLPVYGLSPELAPEDERCGPVEYRYQHPDGSQRWISADIRLFRDASGAPSAIVGVAADISDRKRLEEALRANERQFRMLVEHLPDALLRFNRKGELLVAGGAGSRHLPNLSEGAAHPLDALNVSPAARSRYQEAFDSVWSTGEPRALELECEGPSGPLVLDLRLVPEFDAEGGVESVLGLARDITTARRWAGSFRALFDGLLDAVAVLEARSGATSDLMDFRFVATNPAFVRLFGVPSTVLAGLPVRNAELYLGPALERLIGQAFESRRPAQLATPHRRSGRLLAGAAFPMPMLQVAIVLRDITDQKLAEKELLDSRTELRTLALQLAVVEDRERRKVANYLHDQVGQSLAVLSMKLGELASLTTEDTIKKAVAQLREILTFTIDETRALTFDLSPPILYELGLEAALEWLAERVSEQHEITVDFMDDGFPKPLAEDVAPFVFRAVRELLMNVIKHARATTVEVRLEAAWPVLRVTVADDGVGIPDLAGGKRFGFGLLSIREHLGALGGGLVFGPNGSSGTRVTFVVPLLESAREA
jgi:PAS domain S-box-containing protein